MAKQINRAAAVPALLCLLLIVGGCNSLHATTNPAYRGRTVPVERIGVVGPGASIATQEFIRQGYTTIDLELPAGVSGIEAARNRNIPYVATVDAVDTSQAVWDGFYSYSMRVSDTSTGAVVWTSSGSFGQGGVWINAQASNRTAMQTMIGDFAKTFPPAK